MKITRPEIYYGELANDYVFVKTTARELDYPAGDQNIYTTYQGHGGVPIDSLWRKLLFSAHEATLRIALSQDVTRQSRILLHRQIQERVKKIAPFITFDRDAYMVIAQGGRLFWMIDGYTISDRFPYSEPMRRRGMNYMRNSVKAVVDAYNGTVNFYLSDPEDPMVLSYGKIFPELAKPLDQCRRICALISVTRRTYLRFKPTCTRLITCRIRRSFTTKKTCSASRAGLSAARNKKWSPITPSCACRVRPKKSSFCFYRSRQTNETTCARGWRRAATHRTMASSSHWIFPKPNWFTVPNRLRHASIRTLSSRNN